MEVEYVTNSEVGRHVSWLSAFRQELGITAQADEHVKIRIDNMAMMQFTHNPKFLDRVKHIRKDITTLNN